MNEIEKKIRTILKGIKKNEDPWHWEINYSFYPGELDSLDMATLALHLEENFNIKILDDRMESMYSIENISKNVEELINES